MIMITMGIVPVNEKPGEKKRERPRGALPEVFSRYYARAAVMIAME